MNTLEVENTQGITLKYNTASVIERFGALIIDLVVIGVVTGLLALLIEISDPATDAVYFLLTIPFFFYTLFMEIFNQGKSLGKMALGLKVVRVDGKTPVGYDYFMRWLFRSVDIYGTTGTVGALTASATPRSQRVGDMLADTTVIRVKNIRIPLSRILSLNKLDSYEPTYPQAKNLKEEQVLLIKDTLQRSLKYKNEEHMQALKDLKKRVAKTLEVEKPGDAYKFLNVVIKDYIAQTR